jgi:protein involved in polysaccharide export with SLBB domain
MEIIRKVFLLLCLLILSATALQAQELFYRKNLANIDVEKLTQQDINRFQHRAAAANMSEADVITYLMDKGLTRSEISGLLQRMEQESPLVSRSVDKKLSAMLDKEIENDDPMIRRMYLKSNTPPDSLIFGSELFANTSMDFAPTLQLATPVNYVLGPGDQINITLFGNQEIITDQVISPNGRVTIPYAGVVQLGGLTVEQAEERIRKILISQGFETLASGGTKLNLSVTNYRSFPVTVIGARNSGHYVVPSVASAFHALVLAGGPSSRGSFRSIEVVRKGKIIQRIDLYRFIVNGDRSADVVLEENDVINIPVYDNIVRVKGEVKRQGFFELIEGESLESLLSYAGGYTPFAYKENIYVEQVGINSFLTRDVTRDEFSSYTPASGDVFIIGSITNRYDNRVVISGAVSRPGVYGWDDGLMLSTLLQRSGGLDQSALMSRGLVYRYGRDHQSHYLRFVPEEVSKGESDLALRDGDSIVVADRKAFFPHEFVQVVGEVNKEDKVTYGQGMTALDAVLLAGGMKSSAMTNKIEIARRSDGSGDIRLARIIAAESDAELLFRAGEVELMPNDIVVVKPDPNVKDHQVVRLEGEVRFPGSYVLLRRNELLSSVLERAGGLTSLGDVNGVVIMRSKSNPILDRKKIVISMKNQSVVSERDSLQNLIALNNIQNRMLSKDEDEDMDLFGDNESLLYNDPVMKSTTAGSGKKPVKDDGLKKDENTDEITFIAVNNIEELLRNPGEKYDLALLDEDKILVLERNNSVSVKGMVNNEVSVNYMGSKLRKYLRESGGTTRSAQRGSIYVIEPNGRARMTHSILGIRSYPRVVPGSAVVVPARPQRDRKLNDPASIAAVASILTSAVSVVFLISTMK